MKKTSKIKRIACIGLIFLMSINSFAAIVSDNDGSAFVTKAEFDALKESFNAQIQNYNDSIDRKIDGAIASYLSGIQLSQSDNIEPDFWQWEFPIGLMNSQNADIFIKGIHRSQSRPAVNLERNAWCQGNNRISTLTSHGQGSGFLNDATTWAGQIKYSMTMPTMPDNDWYACMWVAAEKKLNAKWIGQDGDVYIVNKVGSKWKMNKFLHGKEELIYRTGLVDTGWVSPTARYGMVAEGTEPPWFTDLQYYYFWPGFDVSGNAMGNVGSAITTRSFYNGYKTYDMNIEIDDDYYNRLSTSQGFLGTFWDWMTTVKGCTQVASNNTTATNAKLQSHQYLTKNTKRHFIYDVNGKTMASVDGNSEYILTHGRDYNKIQVNAEEVTFSHYSGHVSINALALKGADNTTAASKYTGYYQDPIVKYITVTLPWRSKEYSDDASPFSSMLAKNIYYDDNNGIEHNLAEGMYLYRASKDGKITFSTKFSDYNNTSATDRHLKLKVAKKGFNETLTASDYYNISANSGAESTELDLLTNTPYTITISGIKKNDRIYLTWVPVDTTKDIQMDNLTNMVYTYD